MDVIPPAKLRIKGGVGVLVACNCAGFARRVRAAGSRGGFAWRVRVAGSCAGFAWQVRAAGSRGGFARRVRLVGFVWPPLGPCALGRMQ